jgi:hypothetical protein
VSADIWVGAITTLAGGVLGSTVSLLMSRQQARDAWRQRLEEETLALRRRSEDRRYSAYSDFLTQTRSFRNAVETYYTSPRAKPALAEIDALLQNANDASALVFLVVEGRDSYEGALSVLRTLSRARAVLHEVAKSPVTDPWDELNVSLGKAIREFQNAARSELGVSGPTVAWEDQGRETGAASPGPRSDPASAGQS